MKKEIRMGERTIPYIVRKSKRAKHMRISVNCDGSVFVTQPARIPFVRSEEIVIKKIHWIIEKIDFFKRLSGRIGAQREESSREYCVLKARALEYVQGRVEYFNSIYRFSFRRISIRNQRTRWGSCSQKGNMNFNYRIVHLAPELADYIVVHELCHLVELNHSKEFWKLVGRTIPNYHGLKRLLKENVL